MAWVKSSDDKTVGFTCDTCAKPVNCNVETVRATAQPEPETSDFIMCWRYLQAVGWRSFKRTGYDWSYHCVRCSPAAEAEHREYRRLENERDRIRARNAE